MDDGTSGRLLEFSWHSTYSVLTKIERVADQSSGFWQRAGTLSFGETMLLQGLWSLRCGVQGGRNLSRVLRFGQI